MIRRWSHIINLNSHIFSKKTIFFNYYCSSFKKSIIFKKLRFKNTKFKRRTLIRLKHRNNWMIYLQIFNHWTLDFNFAKAYVRYQLNANVSVLDFLAYDFGLLNSKQIYDYNTFFLATRVSKKTYRFLNHFKFWDFNAAPSNRIYLNTIQDVNLFDDEALSVIPTYFNTNFLWYHFANFKNINAHFTNFNFNLLLCNYEILLFHKILEYYKIMITLWAYTLFKR